MEIIKIEPLVVHVNHRGDWLFVQVHTDAGIAGLGEASHSGHDPRQIEGALQIMLRLNGGRISQTALSSVEQALWDIAAQELGVCPQAADLGLRHFLSPIYLEPPLHMRTLGSRLS